MLSSPRGRKIYHWFGSYKKSFKLGFNQEREKGNVFQNHIFFYNFFKSLEGVI